MYYLLKSVVVFEALLISKGDMFLNVSQWFYLIKSVFGVAKCVCVYIYGLFYLIFLMYEILSQATLFGYIIALLRSLLFVLTLFLQTIPFQFIDEDSLYHLVRIGAGGEKFAYGEGRKRALINYFIQCLTESCPCCILTEIVGY